MELQQIEAIKSSVEAGRMIGCVSRLALRDALGAGRLVELAVPELSLKRRLYTVVHRQKYPSTTMAMFLDLCRAASITPKPLRIPGKTVTSA
jgi:DNA-binding transcriptional LysR family regulator